MKTVTVYAAEHSEQVPVGTIAWDGRGFVCSPADAPLFANLLGDDFAIEGMQDGEPRRLTHKDGEAFLYALRGLSSVYLRFTPPEDAPDPPPERHAALAPVRFVYDEDGLLAETRQDQDGGCLVTRFVRDESGQIARKIPSFEAQP